MATLGRCIGSFVLLPILVTLKFDNSNKYLLTFIATPKHLCTKMSVPINMPDGNPFWWTQDSKTYKSCGIFLKCELGLKPLIIKEFLLSFQVHALFFLVGISLSGNTCADSVDLSTVGFAIGDRGNSEERQARWE